MKKYIVSIVALGLLSVAQVQAQGWIDLNTFDGSGQIYLGTGATLMADGTGTIEVFGGATSSSLSAITAAGVGTTYAVGFGNAGDGNFDAGSGTVTGVGAFTGGYFQIEVWSGAATYAAALTTDGAWFGESDIFTSTTGDTAIPPSPQHPGQLTLDGDIHLTQVPEPATFVLAGLGMAALLAFRRRS
jgi:hypothetical protein